MSDATHYARVLDFWFGLLDQDGLADELHAKRWFTKDEAFDALLRSTFLDDHRAAASGARDSWRASLRGTLALVIVLDQFSRNLFRGTPEMFAYDAKALSVALPEIDAGHLAGLATDERVFLYMPLMHSEELDVQERSVVLFSQFRDELSGRARERLAMNVDYAIRHRDIIARFGRFPHRNATLGRASTPEELAFLEQPGSSFF
jgi:uncharacterized protein (DUF924 family)